MSEALAAPRPGLPPWLKVRLPGEREFHRIKEVSARRGLHTVCEEARCPNISECWAGGTATFMVLGDSCTRGCRFCSGGSAAKPPRPDSEEPERLAETLAEMGLDYAVVTTVCRDDLPDQGAGHLAACLSAVKARCPGLLLEILLQDFRGDESLLARVLAAKPDVAAHNLETVRRLTPLVRDAKAGYDQSLEVLRACRRISPRTPTKSSLMVGLGETLDELLEAFGDLRSSGVDILTIGQYLRPSKNHLPMTRYYTPDEFRMLKDEAMKMGFRHVESGALVRSSYHAHEQAESVAR